MTRHGPAGSIFNAQSHFRADGVGLQHVADLLLRAAHGIGQLGLRPVGLDRGLDEIMDCLHTSFLVAPRAHVNKQTCLAPVGVTGNNLDAMTVAANLRRIREDRKLSQKKLAELARVSQQLVSQIERGENTTTKYLPQIAVALRCNVAELDPSFRLNGVSDDPLVQEIAELVVQLSEQERRLLLGAAQGLIAAGKPEG